jgi:predicted RNA-binding Zn-ribbon protein involved in translation (DUF1610 family)
MDEEPDEERLEGQPLERDERENVQADLQDLGSMQAVFETQGVRGVVVACPDCGSDHYYGWDLLRESLQHMLETGEPRMHEPAFEPKEDDYILWDYGKGYVDALADSGLDGGDPARADEIRACAWCNTPLEPHFGYCPKCGRATAPARLLGELIARGMDEREARALLLKAGFEPFR